MDGMQSWSDFERRNPPPRRRQGDGDHPPQPNQRQRASTSGTAATAATPVGIDALRVAIPAGVSAAFGADDSTVLPPPRLRFHWVRPHPSLAFLSEERGVPRAAAGSDDGDGTDADDGSKRARGDRRGRKRRGDQNGDATTAATTIKAEMETTRRDRRRHPPPGPTARRSRPARDAAALMETFVRARTTTAPPANRATRVALADALEPPRVRVDLSALVDPPLMTAWLPGEETGVSYGDDSDDEGSEGDEG